MGSGIGLLQAQCLYMYKGSRHRLWFWGERESERGKENRNICLYYQNISGYLEGVFGLLTGTIGESAYG